MAAAVHDEESIFEAARQIESLPERAAYLDRACGSNAQLRSRIEGLLHSHERGGDFLSPPILNSATQVDPSGSESSGTLIDRYKLLERIGEGGFGDVWMAEQQEPVRRKVALKIIKLGMDTREVIARFEAERQALALMEHANIAKIHDAGATETGRPYFVMELVRGVRITSFCEQNNLTTEARLRLFMEVCHAVQHAHQKGIIHRDLKPNNIMITLHDGEPMPKVIDFGIAKATQQRLTEKTYYTSYHQFIGTPEYMSPEQTEMSSEDVDTRSDIYSLGVLLYELLVGTTPFDAEQLRRGSYDEICRFIRETDPVTPSRRLSSLGDAATKVSQHRGVQPSELRKLLRGDLDGIVMKALEKDRTRRYETASALARDIERHLNHEPVEARPPSAAYQLQKFVRRNRGPVAAVSGVLATLILGLVLTTAMYFRAEREGARAKGNLEMARGIVKSMVMAPAEEMRRTPNMTQIYRTNLENALDFYRRLLAQDTTNPNLRYEAAVAFHQAGALEAYLGNYAESIRSLEPAIDLLDKLSAEFPLDGKYLEELAACHDRLGWPTNVIHGHEASQAIRRKALASWQRLAKRFPEDLEYRQKLAVGHSRYGIELIREGPGDPAEAEEHLRKAVAIWDELPANFPKLELDREGQAASHDRLGQLLLEMNRFQEAKEQLLEAVKIHQGIRNESPDIHDVNNSLGSAYAKVGQVFNRMGSASEAKPYFDEAIACFTKWHQEFPHIGPIARHLGWSHYGLAKSLMAIRRDQEAEPSLRECLSIFKQLVLEIPNDGANVSSLGYSYHQLGKLLYVTNRREEAADCFEQAKNCFETSTRDLPDHRFIKYRLVDFLCSCPDPTYRDADRAVKLAKERLELSAEDSDSWRVLGIAQYRAHRWGEAILCFKESMKTGFGANGVDQLFLAMAHGQLGEKEKATHWYTQALDFFQPNLAFGEVGYFNPIDLRLFHAEAAELLGVKTPLINQPTKEHGTVN